jgi:serine/threonine-protein kinase HipA
VVRRRHQIDLCQLLGKWPGYKYQSDGGVTFPAAYAALAATRRPAVSRKQLLDWLVFNYVIGNSDAHAKNVSFLVTRAGVDLAPAYDLLCVRVYGVDYDYMAMTIAEENRYGWVERQQWDALAASLSLSPKFLARRRGELARALPAAARRLLERGTFEANERAFLTGVVAIIDQHAALILATCEGGKNDGR